MSNMHTRFFVGGLLVSALASTGCDVSVGECEKDDAGECVDLFPDDEDATTPMDGSARDGAVEASTVDGGAGDATTSADATAPDASGQPLTIDQFCTALLSKTHAWRDKLEECCPASVIPDIDFLLGQSFAYSRSMSLTRCLSYGDMGVSDRITIDATKLQGCADAYNAQLPAAPTDCPSAGFDFQDLEGKYGHGFQTVAQLPACRAAFVGKIAQSKDCTDSLECVSGLRCRPDTGGRQTCQAVATSDCVTSAQCGDGTMCLGQRDVGSQSCVSVDMLGLTSTQRCDTSNECAEGRICGVVKDNPGNAIDEKGCVPPETGTFLCKQ